MDKKYITKYLLIMLFCILMCGCAGKKEKQHEDQHIVLDKENQIQEVTEEETENMADDTMSEEEVHDATYLEYIEDMDESYINKCIFLGDSRMVGMSQAGFIATTNTLAQIGLCHTNAMHTRYKTYAGMDYSFKSYLQSHQASVIYICYGINGITSIKEEAYKKAFEDIVDAVKEYEPDSAIVISSIWPVDDNGQYHATVSTELVKKYNDFLHELALEKNIYYLDLCGQLSLEDGSIDPRFDRGDGLHYNKEGYQVVYDYILHHAVQNIKEDGLNKFSKETFIWENPVKPKEESASNNTSEEGAATDNDNQNNDNQNNDNQEASEINSEEQSASEIAYDENQNVEEGSSGSEEESQENNGEVQDDPQNDSQNDQEQSGEETTVEDGSGSEEQSQQGDDGGIHEDFVL